MTPEDFQQQDIQHRRVHRWRRQRYCCSSPKLRRLQLRRIEWNRRFVEIYDQNEEGQWTVDYAKIDETEDIAPIQSLSKDQEEQAVGRNTTLSDSEVSV